jgi:mRNA-degrading endonuclease YafQ of YafQ-DinJ toxin-antitoxin module
LKISVFKDNPFAQTLDTHKLHGEKKEEWAFSVDYSYRVSFVFVGSDAVLFTDIGTHDMYK